MSMDGYVRVSAVKGRAGDSYQSPSEQRRLIDQAAARFGVKLDLVVVDEDVSGAKAASTRGLEQLLLRCESGESEGIIVAYQDRLSRGSLLEQAQTYDRLDRAGARLIAEGDGIDNRAEGSELLFTIKAAIAREQWKRYQASWRASRENAVKRGVAPYRTPFGYDRGAEGRLVPNEEARLVKMMFELRAGGAGIAEIAHKLPGSWSHSTIAQTLRSRIYLGEISHGDLVNEQAHSALVDEALYDACQVVQPVRTPGGTPRSLETLLAGLVRCDGCGHTLKVVQGYGGRLRYYCKGPYKSGPCSARCLIRADHLDPYVENMFLDFVRGRLRAPTARTARKDLQAAQTAFEKAEADKKGFASLKSAVDPEDFLAGYEQRKRKLDQTRTRLAELRSRSTILDELPSLKLEERWDELDVVHKRRLLGAWVESVRVSKGNGNVPARVQFVYPED